jgi:hypothetical protein
VSLLPAGQILSSISGGSWNEAVLELLVCMFLCFEKGCECLILFVLYTFNCKSDSDVRDFDVRDSDGLDAFNGPTESRISRYYCTVLHFHVTFNLTKLKYVVPVVWQEAEQFSSLIETVECLLDKCFVCRLTTCRYLRLHSVNSYDGWLGRGPALGRFAQ